MDLNAKKGTFMKKIVILFGLFSALVSCGPLNDLKETTNTTKEMRDITKDMKNTTGEMYKTTKELAEISKGMAKSTGRINNYSANTYRDMRLDTSISNGFKALNEMETAVSLEQKVIAAAYYMASFEFQLWKNEDLDDEPLRQKMYALSVKRLFADIKEYVSKDDAHEKPPEENDFSTNASKLRNLYAIAVTLHEINPNQEVSEKVNGVKLVSMLQLVTEGLSSALTKTENLPKIPEYQKIVAQNEELAVMLLQIRYNVLAGKVLKLITKLDTTLDKLEKSKFSWKPDFSRINNAAKVEYAAKVALLAVDARKRLTSNGYKPAEIGLSKIIQNIDLSQLPSRSLTDALSALKASN
ncbi:MAG: hypothetical protein A4S09_08110 [Proteobacteria bacterium SG_bin7]|nr:MAG: hypothetical protein A4S09_08110 [Proteobacteria bacterium SG_bin7]